VAELARPKGWWVMSYRAAVHGLDHMGIPSGPRTWTCDGCGRKHSPGDAEEYRMLRRWQNSKSKDAAMRGPCPTNWLAVPNGDYTAKHFCKECKVIRRPTRRVA
jgi:hypothetical protein